MDNINIFIVLLPALVSGAASAIIASQKGRDGLGWFFVGVFFVPIAIPFALVASPIRSNIESLKTCNYCKELVNHKAVKCPHCQSELKSYSEKYSEPEKDQAEKSENQTSARDDGMDTSLYTASQCAIIKVMCSIISNEVSTHESYNN